MSPPGVLITGAYGFVGAHLTEAAARLGAWVALLDHPDVASSPGAALYAERGREAGTDVVQLCADITREADLSAELTRLVERNGPPDLVFHLAGQASPVVASRRPGAAYEVNVVGTATLLQTLTRIAPDARVLIPSSAYVYGSPGPDGMLHESDPVRPSNHYGASKVAQEEVARIFFETGELRTYVTRSFNHIGPGQAKGFVVPDFASRLVDLERRGGGLLTVGNLAARRDYLDVRDVVQAYLTILDKGSPGVVYNVASGTPWSAQELLDVLLAEITVPIEVSQDPGLLRKADVPVLLGDAGRLRALAWRPQRDIPETLRETLQYWRRQAHHETHMGE